MAYSLTITVRTSPQIDKFKPINMAAVAKVGGRAGANKLREYFFSLDKSRANQLGGARTHFYSQVARSVQQPQLSDDGAKISINHIGAAQRYFGGVIEAKNSKYLTIPARKEAYGKRAREFNDLEVLWGKRGPIALVQRQQTQITKGQRGKKDTHQKVGSLVLFWLVRRVVQKADPTVLPPEDELEDAVAQGIRDYLGTLTA